MPPTPSEVLQAARGMAERMKVIELLDMAPDMPVEVTNSENFETICRAIAKVYAKRLFPNE